MQQSPTENTNTDLHNLDMDSRQYGYINEMPNSVTLCCVPVELCVYKKEKDISDRKSNNRTIRKINHLR